MQVMIVDGDPVLCRALAGVLRAQGFDVLAFSDVSAAREAARRSILDLLVLGESVGGRLTHDLALLAEWRNPGLGVVLLSDRDGEGREEIFDLLPAVRAILPSGASAAEVAQVTLAVARSQDKGTTPTLPHWRGFQRRTTTERASARPAQPADRARPRPADMRPAESRQAEPSGRTCPRAVAASAPPPPAAPRRMGQLPTFLRAAPPARAPAATGHLAPPGVNGPPRSAGPPRRLHLA